MIFVNLRKEEYTDSSRIPTVEIGTPLEDAYRRDLTIIVSSTTSTHKWWKISR